MLDAQTNHHVLRHFRPQRIIAILTLWSFLFSFLPCEYIHEEAWAARSVPELTSVGSEKPGSQALVKELNVDTFTLPQAFGTVRDSFNGTSDKMVIHIQDAHSNYACQQTIAAIIAYFNKRYGVTAVNLEGGSEDYDLSIFDNIDDDMVRLKVTDRFVAEGEMNGAEFFAANEPGKVDLWGVEDPKLYFENLNVYRDSLKNKGEVDRYMKELSGALMALKQKIYSPELMELDKKYADYKDNKIPFRDYIVYLTKQAKRRMINIKDFANIYLMQQALGEEDMIDFKTADAERDKLVDELRNILPKKDLEEMVVKVADFHAGRVSQADVYSYILKLAKMANVDLSKYPDFEKYMVYISLYHAIDKSKLMDEMSGLEGAVKESYFKDPAERELDKLSKNLVLTKNIFNISLARDDYRYYQKNKDSFDVKSYMDFINKEGPRYKIPVRFDNNMERLDIYRQKMTEFYEYSFKRDDAFMRNMRFGVRGSGIGVREIKIAMIVTGGFHTENLCEQFKKQGISYISIMPSFKNPPGYSSPYYSLLAGNKPALDEFFGKALSYSPGKSTIAIMSLFSKMGVDLRQKKMRALQARALAAVLNNEAFPIQTKWGYVVISSEDIPGAKATFKSGGLVANIFVGKAPYEVDTEEAIVLVDGDKMTTEQQEQWIDGIGKEIGTRVLSPNEERALRKALETLGLTSDDIGFIFRETIRVWNKPLIVDGHAGGKEIYLSPDLAADPLKMAMVLVHEVGAAYGLKHADNLTIPRNEVTGEDARQVRVAIAKAREPGRARSVPGRKRDYAATALAPILKVEEGKTVQFNERIGGEKKAGAVIGYIRRGESVVVTAGRYHYKIWIDSQGVARIQAFRVVNKAIVSQPAEVITGKDYIVGSSILRSKYRYTVGDDLLSKEHFNVRIGAEKDGRYGFAIKDPGSGTGTTVEWKNTLTVAEMAKILKALLEVTKITTAKVIYNRVDAEIGREYVRSQGMDPNKTQDIAAILAELTQEKAPAAPRKTLAPSDEESLREAEAERAALKKELYYESKNITTVLGPMRTVAMGDVHAGLPSLKEHFKQTGILSTDGVTFQFKPGEAVLFTGDYMDRGTYPIETMLFLIAMKKAAEKAGARIIFMEGNHDYAMGLFLKKLAEGKVRAGNCAQTAFSIAMGEGWNPEAALSFARTAEAFFEVYRDPARQAEWKEIVGFFGGLKRLAIVNNVIISHAMIENYVLDYARNNKGLSRDKFLEGLNRVLETNTPDWTRFSRWAPYMKEDLIEFFDIVKGVMGIAADVPIIFVVGHDPEAGMVVMETAGQNIMIDADGGSAEPYLREGMSGGIVNMSPEGIKVYQPQSKDEKTFTLASSFWVRSGYEWVRKKYQDVLNKIRDADTRIARLKPLGPSLDPQLRERFIRERYVVTEGKVNVNFLNGAFVGTVSAGESITVVNLSGAVCPAGEAPEGGRKYIMDSIKTVGGVIKKMIYHNLFGGQTAYHFAVAAVPKGADGQEVLRESLASPISRTKAAARYFTAREKIGDIQAIHSMVSVDEKDRMLEVLNEIINLINTGVPKERIAYSISKALLRRMDMTIKDPIAAGKTYDSVSQLLDARTMLTIIDDVPEGHPNAIMPMPYGRVFLEGVARLNLSHVITSYAERGEKVPADVLRDALEPYVQALQMLTNNKRITVARLLVIAKNDPEFFKKMIEVALPGVAPINVNDIKASFDAEAEAIRSL